MATKRFVMWNSNGQRQVRVQTKNNGRWGSTKTYRPGDRNYNRMLSTAQRVGQGGTVSTGG